MVKTPWTRVLDLTCGWFEFVDSEESREENPLTDERIPSEELFQLYQDAGSLAFSEPPEGDFSPLGEAEIRAFLTDRVLPLLMRH